MIGDTFPSEMQEYRDPLTGAPVVQLTHYKAHSHHFYFTNRGWYDGGRKVLFGSDRFNRTNLFSLDLGSGEIMQLTDLEPQPKPREVEFITACVNPIMPEAYFWHGRKMMALDLHSLHSRVLHEVSGDFDVDIMNCTSDGRFVCASASEDMSQRFRVDYLRGYVGFEETWKAMPLSRVLQVAVDGSGCRVAWEEQYWIGHVNTSPTIPNLLTFCHEGPWHKVDNRIWGLDLATGRAWMIRHPQHGEIVGHEYWFADGEHVGYHGWHPDGRKFLGHTRYDDTGHAEASFPGETGHIHSNDAKRIVGDGGKVVRLWHWNGQSYEGPRALCEHNASMKIQQLHVHPRFTPDGRQVLFTSDVTGYGNVYLADVPDDFEALPMVND
jgi:oligogalacturonide lyase